jgi:hypothetical protein
MIKSGQLENRAGMPRDIDHRTGDDKLQDLKDRVEVARVTREDELARCDTHARYSACAACYRRGRDAALRIIDGV